MARSLSQASDKQEAPTGLTTTRSTPIHPLSSQMNPFQIEEPVLPEMDTSRTIAASDKKPGGSIESVQDAVKAKPENDSKKVRRGKKEKLSLEAHSKDKVLSRIKQRKRQNRKRGPDNITNHIKQIEALNIQETPGHILPATPLLEALSTPELSELECGDFCSCCTREGGMQQTIQERT